MLNRGVNGEEASDMLARFETTVIDERPDLVLWQVGTNAVLRDNPIGPNAALIEKGIDELKAKGIDVILIDPQFAPKVIAKSRLSRMLDVLATKAKQNNINLFQRYAVMRDWRERQGIPFDTFVSSDQLHMNDWSYACVAKVLSIGDRGSGDAAGGFRLGPRHALITPRSTQPADPRSDRPDVPVRLRSAPTHR